MIEDSFRADKLHFMSVDMKLKILGFIGGIPLAKNFGGKAMFLLYLFLFVPLLLSIISVSNINLNKRFSKIDKLTAAYFFWVMLSFGFYLVQMRIMGSSEISHRIFSMLAMSIYGILPYIMGRLLCVSEKGIECFVEGLTAGMIFTCVVLLANYVQHWLVDPYTARHEIGQRIPLVIGFISILGLSCTQRLRTLFVAVFLAMSVVCLSETRVAIGAFVLSLLLTLVVCGKKYGVRKFLVVTLAAFSAILLSWNFSYTLQFRVNLLVKTINQLVFTPEQKLVITPEQKLVITPEASLQKKHLTDASLDMRVQIWQELWSKVADNSKYLILGYGQLGPSYIGGQLHYVSGTPVQQYSAHNEYLDVLVRSGFVGLSLYLAVIFAIIFSAHTNVTVNHQADYLHLHLSLALIGSAVYGMFHETTRYSGFGVLFWVFAGILSSRKDGASDHRNMMPKIAL